MKAYKIAKKPKYPLPTATVSVAPDNNLGIAIPAITPVHKIVMVTNIPPMPPMQCILTTSEFYQESSSNNNQLTFYTVVIETLQS